MTRILGFIALLGLMLSAAAHAAALSGIDVAARIPAVWGLHAGVFVVFFPFVLFSRRTFGTKPSWQQLRAACPPWLFAAGIALFVYAGINFFLFMQITEGGNPVIENGKYLLKEHGSLIRELTPAEYGAHRANEVRGFSGHWMVFYFMPMAYFLFVRPRPGGSPADQGPARR